MAGINQTAGQLLLSSGSVSACSLTMGTSNTGWFLGNGLSFAVGGVLKIEMPGSGVAIRYGSSFGQLDPLGSDGTQDFGSASLRWSSVWSVNGTVQTSHSDYKREIQDLPLTLEVPRGISYKWKDTEGTDRDRTFIGYLADNLPNEAFALDENGNIEKRGVKPTAVVGILCSHVRQLQTTISDLETKIASLKNKE